MGTPSPQIMLGCQGPVQVVWCCRPRTSHRIQALVVRGGTCLHGVSASKHTCSIQVGCSVAGAGSCFTWANSAGLWRPRIRAPPLVSSTSISGSKVFHIAGGVRSKGCDSIHDHTSPNLGADRAKRELQVTGVRETLITERHIKQQCASNWRCWSSCLSAMDRTGPLPVSSNKAQGA